MLFKSALIALGSMAVLSEASAINRSPNPLVARQRGGRKGGFGGFGGNNNAAAPAAAVSSPVVNNNAAAAASTCLDTNAVQTGSASTGQANDVAADGQSNSATDTANFINFCSGQTLTNGLQVKTGSCNGIVMGKIPATTNMVSSVITNPKLNDNLAAETTFNVEVNIANLELGTFTNATSTYYSAPQDLSGGGNIIGHTHVTIQSIGDSFQFTTPLDATKFVFFKGINDAGNGQGTVTTAVTGGLPAGNYRVCTMSSSANHQPVLMPVAQRGAQDDCRYFTVGGTGAAAASAAGAADPVATTAAADPVASDPVATTSSAAASTATSKGKKNKDTATSSDPAAAAVSPTVAPAAVSSAAAAPTAAAATGAIGGIAAPAVTDSGDAARPFAVNGNTFVNKSVAVERACAIQNNACADAVNSGKAPGFTVTDCNAQETACSAQ